MGLAEMLLYPQIPLYIDWDMVFVQSMGRHAVSGIRPDRSTTAVAMRR